jgi:hypothetical protein
MDMQTSDNIEIPVPIGPAAESIAARIRAEQIRLTDEERKELDLAEQRQRTLVEGTDAQMDKIELAIDASRSAQVRILERIDLLVPKLHEANAAAAAAELDAVAKRADRARKAGEQLIAEYSKHAATVAPILRKLRAADALVERLNRQLTKAGRPAVETSNSLRCKPSLTREVIERRRVGLGEPEHPHFGKATVSRNDPTKAQLHDGGEYIDTFVEMDVKRTIREPGIQVAPLHVDTVLPSAHASGGPLWDASTARAVDTNVDQTIREMSL